MAVNKGEAVAMEVAGQPCRGRPSVLRPLIEAKRAEDMMFPTSPLYPWVGTDKPLTSPVGFGNLVSKTPEAVASLLTRSH